MTPSDLDRLVRVRDLCKTDYARVIRRTARLSLRDVGREVGVDGATVLRWETSERQPRARAGLRYLDVLDRLLEAIRDL